MSSRRVRILYVQRPSGGGSATGLYEMLRVVDRDRYEPVVLFYESNGYCDRFRELGVRVLVLDGGEVVTPLPESLRNLGARLQTWESLVVLNRLFRRDWPTARHIARVIREEAVDLVHNNDNPRGDRASIIGAVLAHTPQVCHVRFLPDYFRPVDRPLSRFIRFFIYMSRAIERQYCERVGVSPSKGEVIYDPFDFPTIAAAVAEGPRVRRELGIADHERVVTNVGRLVRFKGQDVFLRAMASVVRVCTNVRILVVGAPPPNAPGVAYQRELKQLVVDLGLSDRVIFAGFRPDIPQIMAASDIVVHSASEPEPFGRVIVEAMAAGKSTIATAAGGVTEIVDDGSTGLLVPLGDPVLLADAVLELFRDPSRARLMGERARRVAQERFAPERFADALQRVYERVLVS